MSRDFQSNINQCVKVVINNDVNDNIPCFYGLINNFMVMESIKQSLPKFATKQQLFKGLRRKLYDYLDNYYEFDVLQMLNDGMKKDINCYILDLEYELRQICCNCICNSCKSKTSEDYEFWSFASINVTIDTDYEHHRRIISEMMIPEFRVKYTTTIPEHCLMYTACSNFTKLLNNMHHGLNAKFITVYDFLKPMKIIQDDIDNCVYNEDDVIYNNYLLVRSLDPSVPSSDVHDINSLMNMFLCFYKNITNTQYTYCSGHEPSGNFNVSFTKHFNVGHVVTFGTPSINYQTFLSLKYEIICNRDMIMVNKVRSMN
jgi:hypothetical protein